MTQDNLASAIGRTAEAISNIERGKSLPSLETLLAIADVLAAPARDLFPPEKIDVRTSAKRLHLSDRQLEVALNQLRALTQLGS